MSFDPYLNYTSSTNFAGQDEAELTKWSSSYFAAHIRPHLPRDKETHILEIGCGYGRNIKTLQEIGYYNVRGIDISSEQIEYATQVLGLDNVEMSGAIEFLAGIEGVYDAILLLDVLEHLELEYSVQLIGMVYSALKPGGLFVIQVPNGLAPLTPHRYGDITHLRAYTTLSMDQNLRMGGFANMLHYALPPHVHGAASLIRRVLWSAVFWPLIAAFMLVANGSTMGGIYTANMLTVARKD